MELGRVTEAESALAAFEHEARLAGDAADQIMGLARHAMLATIRGRFAEAETLASRVARAGRGDPPARHACADGHAPRLAGRCGGRRRSTVGDAEQGVQVLLASATQQPGRLYEATAARVC